MVIARGTTGGVDAYAANGSRNQSTAGSKASPRQMDRMLIGVAPGRGLRLTAGLPTRAFHEAHTVPPRGRRVPTRRGGADFVGAPARAEGRARFRPRRVGSTCR